ncbi:MAG: GNAT family N-acetyltransferase [Candidatus Heimdallarchaeota archaeon]|nr:GNAT family N-acetyltransferase [Candidatus Heimdallarchaeota archaeon]
MNNYSIKNFQEEFLEEQEKVGIEATKDWHGFGQTSAAILKQIYSGKNFDPETKFYAFKDDKLVGFLTSTIQPEDEEGIKIASLEFPITLPEHKESAKILFNSAIETLKKKGVQKVRTRVSDLYKGTVELAKKWGYKYYQDLYLRMEANIENLSIKESKIKVEDFEVSRDLESMIQIFVEKAGTTEEYARTNFDRITKDKETFPIHLIVRKDDKIVGRILAYKIQNDPKLLNFSSVYHESEEYFNPLMSTAIRKTKDLDVEKVGLFLFRPTPAIEEKYQSFGFSKTGKIDYFEKEI